VWPALDLSPLESEPARLPTFPVERGFDPVALDHDHDFPSRIPQPVALEEKADLLLHPFDLPARSYLAAPSLQHPDIRMVVFPLDLPDLEASPRQMLGELSVVKQSAHAPLGQELFERVLARCGLPAPWPLRITHERPHPDLGLAAVLAGGCAEEIPSGLRLRKRV
jgi:hypothetical protein